MVDQQNTKSDPKYGYENLPADFWIFGCFGRLLSAAVHSADDLGSGVLLSEVTLTNTTAFADRETYMRKVHRYMLSLPLSDSWFYYI